MIDAREVLTETVLLWQPNVGESLIKDLSIGDSLNILTRWIQNTLKIELTRKQYMYLYTRDYVDFRRQEGHTTAYCIKLALTYEPIDLRLRFPNKCIGYAPSSAIRYDMLHYYSDMPGLGMHYNQGHFKRTFREIWLALKKSGLKVREIEGLPESVLK